MQTENGLASSKIPAHKLLDRDLSLSLSADLRALGGGVLRQVIDEAARVFERCWVTARGSDEHLGVLLPYLQLVEHLDGVEIALAGASRTAAVVILRAAFEALLTLRWSASDREMRYARAYVVCDTHRRISSLKRFVDGSGQRKSLLAALAADSLARNVTVPIDRGAQGKIAGYHELLRKPNLQEAESEYQRLGRPNVPFYAFWGGPPNLEQLARKLSRSGHYEFLYRSWSRTVHAEDMERQLSSIDGEPAVRPLRSGEGLAGC